MHSVATTPKTAKITTYPSSAYPLSWSYPASTINREAKENWPTSPNSVIDTSISPQSRTKKIVMSDRSPPNNRWLLNSNAQDPNGQQWELVDELSRMKINPDGNVENVNIHTPPRSYPVPPVQRGEGSPSSGSGKSSPPSSDRQRDEAHSRNSSIDTGNTSAHDASFSSATKVLLGKSQVPHSLTPEIEHKERPHSFSGGLSTADLRRLQQAGEPNFDSPENQKQAWMNSHHEKQASEQLSYPSLSNNLPRHIAQPAQPQRYEVRVQPREDAQIDYNGTQRSYGPLSQGPQQLSPSHQQHFSSRSANVVPVPYRQSQRGFPPAMASPTQMAYPNGQAYDIMMSGAPHEHPAVARVQQQHNVYPRTHHHTNSDPNIRDPAAMAILNGVVQPPFAPNMYQNPMTPPTPMHVYANQYFTGQEFARPDLVAAQNMAARLQPQYTGQYGMPVMDGPIPSPPATANASGPSANNRKLGLYKTELCRSWEEKGSCRYGTKCQFAHGEEELRSVSRHPKYKTEICRTFWVSGSCPYGKRCCFIHTELPTNGNTAAPAGSDANKSGHSRERSSSTNSDPNDASSSLLARIRNQESSVTPSDAKPATTFQILGRPTALRVDTALDGATMKQNKSAFPSFASNVILPSKESGSLKSPAPVTAGPDIGRHNNFSYGPTRHKTSSSSSSIRHSFNGDDLDISFSPTPPSTGLNYAPESPSAQTPRGHARAGSSGNWGSIGRASLGASSFPSAAAELPGSSPWSTQELAVGSSRLHEKGWN